jgi:superkiller protein 3
VVDHAVEHAKHNGSRRDYKNALRELYLPTSTIYDFLEGRVPHPGFMYTRLAEITEAEETERINREIGERRTRLGAKIGQVSAEVMREVFAQSDLEAIYTEIINWTRDDDVRRTYEEKLLVRAYDYLLSLPQSEKSAKRERVMQLAQGMVIIRHPFALAWQVELEWQDVENITDIDKNTLLEFIQLFPESGVAKVLRGYFGQDIKVSAPDGHTDTDDNLESEEKTKEKEPEKPRQLSEEERLILLVEGLEDSKGSAFAHRIVSDHYLSIDEYESCVDVCRSGITLYNLESQKSGLPLQHAKDAMNSNLATSLVYYQSPKNHPEARELFNDILTRKAESTAALLGVGLIYEEQAEYEKAVDFLERASQRDPQNARIGTEAAWCKVLTGDISGGLATLNGYLEGLLADRHASSDLKAQTLYRVGQCGWSLNTDKASRKSRDGPYARFIDALRTNPNYAPPYTSLGIYYADYTKDRKRARQCFQKAFELSAAEIDAAKRLAQDFANNGEWELVELVTHRAIDSGACKPAPGSKRKGVSWPFSALGVVQMNKQEYPKAVISFQAALRIAPLDYNAWVGLGESYHSSGRYIAAQRALEHAQTLEAGRESDNAWFAQYMLANVFRELSDYDQALARYQQVLDTRPEEFGVAIAYLQTLIERAQQSIESGFFGRAAHCAEQALVLASKMDNAQQTAFNFWRAVGDACSVFALLPGNLASFPVKAVHEIFLSHRDMVDDSLVDDDVTMASVIEALDPDDASPSQPDLPLTAAIMAYKAALHISASNEHAQAVAWYNLGWIEWHAHLQHHGQPSTKKHSKHVKSAIKSFKRAIELEAGNAEFWNALGVVTTTSNPRIAQHSFVRSLHLNERSARTWANLGTLYLTQSDVELAHNAFSRAQSTDPELPQAWVGEGLIALLVGDVTEALSHFTHAMEIANASAVAVKQNYVVASFDNTINANSSKVTDLVQPIFALQQLTTQLHGNMALLHLLGLLQERVGDYAAAVTSLEAVCADAEARYEQSEDTMVLGQFANAKADLSRCQLGATDIESAIENAQTVLDLTAEVDPKATKPDEVRKTRLSAHLSAGLSYYQQSNIEDALDMFRAALEESRNQPEVVCLLSQMLWAKGGEQERKVAKEQLFDCIEAHPQHVEATTLLGAMSVIEDDPDTREAVLADMHTMRTDYKIDAARRAKIEDLLSSISSLTGGLAKVRMDAAVAIMLGPSAGSSWSRMASLTSEAYPAEMALKTADNTVPPNGGMTSEDLSSAFAMTENAGDAQRAIALCPWQSAGWQSLQSCVA